MLLSSSGPSETLRPRRPPPPALENHVQTPPSKLTPRLLNFYLKIVISCPGTGRGSLSPPSPSRSDRRKRPPGSERQLAPRLLNLYLKLLIFGPGPSRGRPTTPALRSSPPTFENDFPTPSFKLIPRLLNSYLKIDISGSGTVRGSLNPLPFLPTVENDLPTVSVKLSPRLLNFYLKLAIFKLGPVSDSPTSPPPPPTAPRKRPPTTGLQIYSPAIKVLFEN